MTTILFVHAHPDDEASATSATMAMASDKGDRVVVVYATNGDPAKRPQTSPRVRPSCRAADWRPRRVLR